jgi:hypothetical protein
MRPTVLRPLSLGPGEPDQANGHKKTRSPKLKQVLLRFSRISYAPAS